MQHQEEAKKEEEGGGDGEDETMQHQEEAEKKGEGGGDGEDETMLHQEEAEKEEEGGGDGEDIAPPGLPEFLRRYVEIGKFVPVPLSDDVRLGESETLLVRLGDSETLLVRLGESKTLRVRLGKSETLLEAPSRVTPLLIKNRDQFFDEVGGAAREPKPGKTLLGNKGESVREFFQSTAGEFLIGIGLSRVHEQVNRDLLRAKEHEMKKTSIQTVELMQEQHKLTKALQQAKMANKPFKFKMRSCRQCDFKTESILVLEGHLLKPHITSRREIQCCFCKYSTRDAKAIVFHMETVHKKLPTMEPPPQFYECPFCSFEANVKAKANSHINRCQKDFNNNTNQVPSCDFQLPGVTAKPITIEDMKTYKKKTASHTGAATKSNPNRAHISLLQSGAPAALSGAVASLHHQKFLFSASQNLNHGRGRPKFQQTPARNRIYQVVGSSTEVTSLLNGSQQSNLALARPVKPASDSGGKRSVHAVAPKRPSPGERPQMSGIMESSKSVAGAFVVCELCDGCMKDLESLGAHMNRVHRVKIHAKLLTSRPPLNCQKCQWRFFTDQGLERHLLGAHGLVTSNMQELTNSNEDGGRCTVCGRFFAAKIVAHMSQVHRVVLKPAHLSYKCTVCTETFNLYRLFERHVYTVHGVGLKRPASGSLDDKPAKQPVTAKRVSDHTTTKTKQESEGSNDIPSKPAPESPTSGSSDTEEEYSEKMAVAPAEPPDSQMGAQCATCEENVEDLREHVEEKHMRGCKIRLCHIEKCDHCLRSFNGMIVMHTMDSGDQDSSEEQEDNTGPADADGPPGAKDADFLEAKNPEVDDQHAEAK